MFWVSYSSSSICIAFVGALLRLLLFAVSCHLLLWWHCQRKTATGWIYHLEEGAFNKGGGLIPRKGSFIAQQGWFYPPQKLA